MKRKNTLRKIKFFWAWEDHKEEAWLEEMSRQGWHLSSVGIPAFYEFISGESKSYTYRLDFITENKKEERQTYFQLFEDAGWVHIGELGGWQYFRKLSKPGELAEIYTDNHSKIQKYKRLLGFLSIIALSLIPMFVIWVNSEPSTFKTIIQIVYGILILIYVIAFGKIYQRIIHLQ